MCFPLATWARRKEEENKKAYQGGLLCQKFYQLLTLNFGTKGCGRPFTCLFFIIVLSTLFGTILAVMRNGKNPILRWMASIYVEFVRNVPNLLWFSLSSWSSSSKSTAAGITSFHGLHFSGLGGNHSWGLNSIDHGQTEAGLSQGFNNRQIFIYIIFPQAIRKMLPSIISQFVTGHQGYFFPLLCYSPYKNCLVRVRCCGYYEPSQIFTLYGIVVFSLFRG